MKRRRLCAAFAAFLFALCLGSGPVWGATGCELNDADRDVKRFFPESTRYEAVTVEILRLGGDRLLAKVESRLRDKLRGLYESIKVPYTIYVIYQGDERVGYIHGVNQKGRYGSIQVFLALDPEERIQSFYIQKISGADAGKFREPAFQDQFVGLTLEDFDRYEVATGKATGKVAEIANPVPEAEWDFRFILRGTKKNLILVDEFLAISPELSGPELSGKQGSAPK